MKRSSTKRSPSTVVLQKPTRNPWRLTAVWQGALLYKGEVEEASAPLRRARDLVDAADVRASAAELSEFWYTTALYQLSLRSGGADRSVREGHRPQPESRRRARRLRTVAHDASSQSRVGDAFPAGHSARRAIAIALCRLRGVPGNSRGHGWGSQSRSRNRAPASRTHVVIARLRAFTRLPGRSTSASHGR